MRQDLTPDSPYADAVVHGDGLISLQFRRDRFGPTMEVKSPLKPPATIKLEPNGDLFTLSLAPVGEAFRPAASVTVALPGQVHPQLVTVRTMPPLPRRPPSQRSHSRAAPGGEPEPGA